MLLHLRSFSNTFARIKILHLRIVLMLPLCSYFNNFLDPSWLELKACGLRITTVSALNFSHMHCGCVYLQFSSSQFIDCLMALEEVFLSLDSSALL